MTLPRRKKYSIATQPVRLPALMLEVVAPEKKNKKMEIIIEGS